MPALLYGREFSISLTATLMLGIFTVFPLAYLDKISTKVCTSKECMTINENFKNKVDFTVNPCEDFYKFACGKYNRARKEIKIVQLEVKKNLLNILKANATQNDHKALKFAKEMFQSCLEHDSNIEDLKKMINHIGGWSLLDPNWKKKDFSLVEFFSKSMEIGYFPKSLFVIDTQMCPITRQSIIIVRPRVEFNTDPIERLLEIPWPFDLAINKDDFHDYLNDIFVPLFATKMNIDKIKVKKEIFKFERLREIINNINQQPAKPKRLQLVLAEDLYSYIPWKKLLEVVFKIQVSHNDTIQIDCPQCLHLLDEFIRDTSTKSLVTYLMGSFVFETITNADNDIMKEWLKFTKQVSKEEHCANKVSWRIMDYEYINRYFDKNVIPTIQDFIQKHKSAMKSILNGSTVLDSESRSQAINKVNGMVFKIGHDDEIHNGQVLNYYDNLNVHFNRTSYLSSLFTLMKYKTEKILKKVAKPAQLCYLQATAGNAANYIYFNNIFNVLAGALYSKENRPQYLNFAGLGFIIAHEMNHAFDLAGRKFDDKGVLSEWWNPETAKNHWEKIECIRQQYSSFTNPETGNKVNGYLTLSENYADLGGIEVAYKAYRDFPKDKELLLQHFQNFTFNQMFWLAFASNKCAKYSKEEVLRRERISVHAMERIRVNGLALNSKGFIEDWNCKENTPMNPKKKCHVWE